MVSAVKKEQVLKTREILTWKQVKTVEPCQEEPVAVSHFAELKEMIKFDSKIELHPQQ